MFIAPCLQWSSFVPLRRDARAPQRQAASGTRDHSVLLLLQPLLTPNRGNRGPRKIPAPLSLLFKNTKPGARPARPVA